jgi:CDP-glucose 4,6-dehydratase
MDLNSQFWQNKKVFITGHTGFKGSWLVLMLKNLGAQIAGYSIDIPTKPSIFELCDVQSHLQKDIRGDICDHEKIKKEINEFKPDVLFHLAAQPLVRLSYKDPFTTYNTNVMGTLSVLMAANQCDSLSSIVNITTDKCYENREWEWAYRENDSLGGHDPYSSSKACAEILSASLRKSFLIQSGKKMATARAGNVIGGGDFASDRIVPDFMRALERGVELEIRSPHAIRPWQHVMEPLLGYISLAEKLQNEPGFSEAWNFGPDDSDCRSVNYVVQTLHKLLPEHKGIKNVGSQNQPHEATFLKLDCSKAKSRLKWAPKLDIDTALALTAGWYRCYLNQPTNIKELTSQQIHSYFKM